MKIYVAGSSRELERAEAAMVAIKGSDLELSHNWVQQIRDVGQANPVEREAQRKAWVIDSLEKVRLSAVLWLLLPRSPTIGAWVELGAAAAFDLGQAGPRRLIVTSGEADDRYRSIFTALATRHFDTDGEAASHLKIYAARFGI